MKFTLALESVAQTQILLQSRLLAYAFATLNLQPLVEGARFASLRLGFKIRDFATKAVYATGSLTLLFLLAAQSFSAQIIRGPYVEGVLKDRAVIRFRTDVSTVSWLRYGDYPSCDQFMTISQTRTREHQFVLYGLLSDTTHCYQIFLPVEETTAVYKAAESAFQTMRGVSEHRSRFMVFGNSAGGSGNRLELAERMKKKYADFIIHTGDVVESGLDFDADEEYFIPYRDIISGTPVFFSVGDREYGTLLRPEDPLKFLGENFAKYHNMPISGKNPHYYYFDCGNARFIAIDVNSFYGDINAPSLAEGSAQHDWLKYVLSRTRLMWKVVFFHVPAYSSGEDGSNEKVRKILSPLFSRYGVDLVFQGHDGDYERTKPIKNGEVSKSGGTVYITFGGAGGPLSSRKTENAWTEKFFSGRHFGYAEIKEHKFKMTVYGLNGETIDRFEIKK